jgi:flagellar biosynthesis protein FlhF
MRLKSFYAKTVSEAMQMVKDTLGEDAVIVATREEPGGKVVRVTAAIEQEDSHMPETAITTKERQDPAFEIDTVDEPAAPEDWLQYDEEDSENVVVEQLTDAMLRHSVPDEITDQVISCATVIGVNSAGRALVAALEHLYSFRPIPQKPSETAIMLVGPPGAGKTLATAKLAARSVMAGHKVAVISTDTVRAGGVEQLAAFTKLMRVNLQKAANPGDLRKQLDLGTGADHIYIDTGGMNPFDAEDMRELARFVAAGDIEPLLVLPAGIDADESGEIARVYATLGIKSLLPTRLDIARRMGGLLAAAHHGSLLFSDASNNPKVADGLLPLSPERLAHLLMPNSARRKQTSPAKKTAKTG